MKILIDHDLVNVATPGVLCGFSINVLNSNIMSTYDSFDVVNPDIYIGKLGNLTNGLVKNIEERPALKTYFLKTKVSDDIAVEKLKERLGDSFTVSDYAPYGDVIKYYNKPSVPYLKADITCIEEDLIDNLELLYFKMSLKYRIFSDKRVVAHSNYCGVLPEHLKAPALTSSRYAIVDQKNQLNCYLCDCRPISSFCDAQNEVETDYSSEIKEAKESILSGSTNFHAFSSILDTFGYNRESRIVLEKLKELL